MTRAGFKQEVLRSNTIWLCASCYSCTVECPREIRITDIMYTLKQRAIQEKVYPRRFPIPILAKEFFKSVVKTGRSNEIWIVIKMFLKTNPLNLLKQGMMGMKLMLRGRSKIGVERMEGGAGDLQTMMDHIDKKRADVAASEVGS